MPVTGLLAVALVLFLILLAVLWVLMPFAIFGTKDLLREQISEQKKTNALLQRLADQQDRAASQTTASTAC